MLSLRNIFPGTKKKQSIDSLRLKIERFRALLEENNRALDIMADAEEIIGGDFLFDMQYVRTFAEQIEECVGKVVLELNFITGNSYVSLADTFDKIRTAIRDTMESKLVVPDVAYVLGLDDIDYDSSGAVGEKMARLGEIRKRFNYKVPDGFVITTRACRRFFDKIKLVDQLREITDTAGRGSLSAKELESKLKDLISSASLPRGIKKEIRHAVALMEKSLGNRALFALRSSAVGEDGELSFAGLHDTFLGVKGTEVLDAYKRVLASLFNSRAIEYRDSRGEPLDNAMMAVGCLEMIPAVSSGVLYTLDPTAPERNVMLVSAAPGLGKTVVEGKAEIDRFVVSRAYPHEVVSREVANKEMMYETGREGGLQLVPLPPSRKDVPCVSDEFLADLASAALRIEHYMKTAQDIEWAQDPGGDIVFLQTRPLQIRESSISLDTRRLGEIPEKYRILISNRGTITCRGIGYGRVVVVKGSETREDLPEDAVLVAHYSSPHLAELLPRASAVITDVGAPTGHLATITRELRVPSIMDVGVATKLLADGMEVTVDAEENIIYEGRVEELILYQLLKKATYEDIKEFRILRKMLRYVTPLNLKNPAGENFTAEHCETYHDIVRFAHEKAVEYFIEGHDIIPGKKDPYCKRVHLDVPLDLKVIDIGGGLALKSSELAECGIHEIRCEPLKFLLEGLNAPGAWSQEPAGMDFDSFMSSITGSSVLGGTQMTSSPRNLAIVSDRYLNLSLHLGYHFNQVDSYISDVRNDNYIYFRFSGGMTNISRRSRRARMISVILEKHDFAVETFGDFVVARIKKFDREIMLERLKMLGYLIGFTRQMDVRMKTDLMIEKGVEEFMESMYNV